MNISTQQDTIVALATGPSHGAIGVIRLSGKQAINIANEVFHGKDLHKQATHTLHFGTIRNEAQIIDEAVVSLFKSPRSYTKEDVVEISCHGSTYILQEVIQLLIKKGARMANAGEFTMRAFLNGQMDLSQAEAVADLIASENKSAHKLAMQQMRGGFSNEIQELRTKLIKFASLLELELDFSEEDVEFADRTELNDLLNRIKSVIKSLLNSFQLGNVLKNGVNTVLAGRPNAGKSTLLNAMLNEDRAIVSKIAGTTRDTIEEILNIKGVNFRIIDTAGIREATDQIESIGVEKTMEKINQSAILVYVFDLKEMTFDEVKYDLESLYKQSFRLIICGNKSDLISDEEKEEWLEQLNTIREKYQFPTFMGISAKEGINIQLLKDDLYELINSGQIESNTSIVSNGRHYDALQGALQTLVQAQSNLDSGISSDFVAMDIRQTLYYLGLITGEISTDDLLDSIFRDFCIGK